MGPHFTHLVETNLFETRYNRLAADKERISKQQTVQVFQQATVVACTMTGAAIWANELREVAFDFVLTEEAAENIEPHEVCSGRFFTRVIVPIFHVCPLPVQNDRH